MSNIAKAIIHGEPKVVHLLENSALWQFRMNLDRENTRRGEFPGVLGIFIGHQENQFGIGFDTGCATLHHFHGPASGPLFQKDLCLKKITGRAAPSRTYSKMDFLAFQEYSWNTRIINLLTVLIRSARTIGPAGDAEYWTPVGKVPRPLQFRMHLARENTRRGGFPGVPGICIGHQEN